MSPYVTTVDPKRAKELLNILIQKGLESSTPPHTLFCAKKKGLSVTFYQSGKLVIQGKETSEFVEFFLEPEFLQTFTLKGVDPNIDRHARIGVDESGKGDFFGPLAVAAVFCGPDQIDALLELGVADSKTLSDQKIIKIAPKIRSLLPHHIVLLNPETYNRLYEQFNNLNHLLAWGHATAIEKVVQQTKCSTVLIDQFASDWVVKNQLKKKSLTLDVTQRPKAESDPVVAAASILARYTFVMSLKKLGDELGIPLAKGASAKVLSTGRKIIAKFGPAALDKLCKKHFSTYSRLNLDQ